MSTEQKKTMSKIIPDTPSEQPKRVEVVEEEKEVNTNIKLEFTPSPLTSFVNTMRINSDELAVKIRQAYASVFHDLKGVNIVYLNGDRFNVEFFFEINTEEVPANSIRNIVSLTKANTVDNNLFYRQQAIQHKIAGETYTISDETKALLADVMFGPKEQYHPKSKKWASHIKEFHVSANEYSTPLYRSGAERIYVRVTDIDIRKVLRKIYGKKMVISTVPRIDDSGNEYDENLLADAYYNIRYVGNKNQTVFTVHIEQFDTKAVEQFQADKFPVINPNALRFY